MCVRPNSLAISLLKSGVSLFYIIFEAEFIDLIGCFDFSGTSNISYWSYSFMFTYYIKWQSYNWVFTCYHNNKIYSIVPRNAIIS